MKKFNEIGALERHLTAAKLLLEDASESRTYPAAQAQELWSRVDDAAVVCVYGLCAAIYALARPWLDIDASRRLVFVEDDAGALLGLLDDDDAILLLNDVRVKIHFLETVLQTEPVAKKIAWSAVFKKLAILRFDERGHNFQKQTEKYHLAAHLLLSDASDWGIRMIANARANCKVPYRRGTALWGKFNNIPAIIVGAGPSLEKNGHLLKTFENRALIFSGGSALSGIDVEPNFAAAIDPIAAPPSIKTPIPFCFQSRVHPEFAHMPGERLLFPDSNSSLLNWLQDMEEPFDGGWTVGNFLTRLAVMMGCNPVIFVGMDLCYRGKNKYAHLDAAVPSGLVQTKDCHGNPVFTQRDWLMAASWTEELSLQHPDVRFINATEGGIAMNGKVEAKTLGSLNFPFRDLRERVHTAIQSIPLMNVFAAKWDLWQNSLRENNELVQEKLLLPLWQVWSPIFEREVDVDLSPFSHEEKMKVHQTLFFQEVLKEHLNAL